MNIIFCDIDGVLNLERHRNFLKTKNNNKEEWAFNNIYDPESMINLRKLVLANNLNIVSSSNRNCDTFCLKAFEDHMNIYGLKDLYYDAVCIDSKDKKY